MIEKQILTIQETVTRAKERGMPVSAYTLRRAIKTGALPCRIVGKTYLIAWRNVEGWLMCEDGQDNTPCAEQMTASGVIRKIEVN